MNFSSTLLYRPFHHFSSILFNLYHLNNCIVVNSYRTKSLPELFLFPNLFFLMNYITIILLSFTIFYEYTPMLVIATNLVLFANM